VKIYEAKTELNKLAEKIYEIKMDGYIYMWFRLVWNREHKILDVAFGIKKLQVACVIEDDKVSTDDLFEIIEGWEEVQSTEVVTMQKVWLLSSLNYLFLTQIINYV
jgi:elongation factor 1-beta